MKPQEAASVREGGALFEPAFDSRGLLTAVAVHAETGAVLMVAHMNAEALAATAKTGRAHFWSRRRDALWMKGETSGHVLVVREIRVDCDQDCLLLRVLPAGPACHTGAPSCFFRTLGEDGRLYPVGSGDAPPEV